jgi:predicted CopG family antitoxin
MRKLTTISVSKKNYLALKRLGTAGDSLNDVITEVLKNQNQAKESKQLNT